MIIVLGSGLLASEIIKQTSWPSVSRKADGFDITDPSTWKSLKQLISFSSNPTVTLINCIAFTKTYEDDFSNNWNVNVVGTKNLIEFCNSIGAKLIHVSTDYFYSNSISQASETDVPVHLPTWYGYSKLVADALVQLESSNYLICRESHKPFPFPYDKAWTDQYTNGDFVPAIADLIIKLINKKATGVFNVGTDVKTWQQLTGAEPISKPDSAPADVTMNTTKMKNFLK